MSRSASAVIWDWRGRNRQALEQRKAGKRAALRKKGAIQGIIGMVIGFLIWRFLHPLPGQIVMGIALFMMVVALVSPDGLFLKIQSGLTVFGRWVGSVVAAVLLTPVFYLFFAVFRLFFRSGKKSSMKNWLDKNADTYWVTRAEAHSKESYEKQF